MRFSSKIDENTRAKVNTRNNLLWKFVKPKWGADSNTLRIVVSLSAAEYACPVWQASAHPKNIDVALNDFCRTITDYLKLIEVYKLYT